MTWDETVTSNLRPGILINFTGGNLSVRPVTDLSGEAPEDLVPESLTEIEPVVSAASAAYNRVAWLDHWIASPWHHGACCYLRRGRYARSSGIEPVQEGALHFCGERPRSSSGGSWKALLARASAQPTRPPAEASRSPGGQA